jgi:integrase/recombinase XerD
MYTTGIRLAEEENLNVADINFEDRTLFVRMGKEGKDRYVCVDAETLEMLETWIDDRELTDSLFDISDRQVARIIEGAAKMTGVAQKYAGMKRRFSPHSLRHSYATHCYENGMKLFALKKLMGHEYLGTTLQYVETAMAFEREEYEKAGPLAGNDGQEQNRKGFSPRRK